MGKSLARLSLLGCPSDTSKSPEWKRAENVLRKLSRETLKAFRKYTITNKDKTNFDCTRYFFDWYDLTFLPLKIKQINGGWLKNNKVFVTDTKDIRVEAVIVLPQVVLPQLIAEITKQCAALP